LSGVPSLVRGILTAATLLIALYPSPNF